MRFLVAATLFCFGLSLAATAQDVPLRALMTGDDSRGWEAVGRLNIGRSGFCTGSLIAPQIVLTAAHCLFDRATGVPADPATIEFLAGWRDGRAVAYRGIRRALPHPSYVYEGENRMDRVAYDLALLELDRPIRLPSIKPLATDRNAVVGDAVAVVSYALDRSEAPSLQELCHVLNSGPGVLVLSCSVDFGSSGSPIFRMLDGKPHVVSVVSAKAEVDKKTVAVGTTIDGPLQELQALLNAGAAPAPSLPRVLRVPVDDSGITISRGAKFIRP